MDKKDVNFSKYITESITDIDLLYLAYSRIKSKPGNMTPGPDAETLDGIKDKSLQDIIRGISTGTFKFKPARTVLIPKPNGKTRTLGVASPRDKLVQEAMRLILEAIYQKDFSRHSHGFIAGRSCHTALKDLKGRFGYVN